MTPSDHPDAKRQLEGDLIGKHLATINLWREADNSIHVTFAEAAGVREELGDSGAPLHLCALNALRAAVEIRGPSTPWQPIETAPKDAPTIDLWLDGVRLTDCTWLAHGWGRVEWQGRGDNRHTVERIFFGKPTHWMPSPDAPVQS